MKAAMKVDVAQLSPLEGSSAGLWTSSFGFRLTTLGQWAGRGCVPDIWAFEG